MREKERKGRGASVRQRTRLSLATPMIHRIYSQTVCQTIGQEFGETITSVIGAQAQKEIRTSERYVHYCISSDRETTEHEPDEGCAPAWGMEMQGGALKSKVVVKKGGTTILQGGLYTGSG